jgi:nucleoid-associated protein YgaU
VSLLNLFKLEKLCIDAYGSAERNDIIPKTIEMMFNPTTYNSKHAIAYESPARQGINTPGKSARYAFTPAGELSFKFILDGTGVNYIGVAHLLSGRSVRKDIQNFMEVCYDMNGSTHQPKFLTIRWGSHLTFESRLKTVDIAYKLFDKNGDPLRAELDVVFLEDRNPKKIKLDPPLSSPDVTHVRVVKSGDTLPLLCREIYGSSAWYLRVAADNGLEDFRNLKPGQKLRFAPLEGGEGPSGV